MSPTNADFIWLHGTGVDGALYHWLLETSRTSTDDVLVSLDHSPATISHCLYTTTDDSHCGVGIGV